MAIVYIPAQLAALCGGRSPLEVEGATVRQVIDNLELVCPGIRERLLVEGRLRPNISVAIDGEVSPIGLIEPVSPDSEVHFVAAISGGCTAAGSSMLDPYIFFRILFAACESALRRADSYAALASAE